MHNEEIEVHKNYSFIGASVRGTSHVKNGLPNQDYIDIKEDKVNLIRKKDEESIIFYDNESYEFNKKIIISLADGHGSKSCIRSDKGSKFAVNLINDILDEFPYETFIPEPNGLSLIKNELDNKFRFRLVKEWKEAVKADYYNSPLTEEEINLLSEKTREKINNHESLNSKEIDNIIYKLYGSTVIGTLVTNHFIFFIQLGDGDLLLVYDENDTMEVRRPISSDIGMIANETHSLCEDNAIEAIKTAFILNMSITPKLIMMSTDGYSNAFIDNESFEKVGKDIWCMIKDGQEKEIKENIINWLNYASEKSGDDISIGLIYEKTMEKIDE